MRLQEAFWKFSVWKNYLFVNLIAVISYIMLKRPISPLTWTVSNFTSFLNVRTYASTKCKVWFSRLGAWGVSHYLLLFMNRLNKTESAIFMSWMHSMLPKDPFTSIYFTIDRILNSKRNSMVSCCDVIYTNSMQNKVLLILDQDIYSATALPSSNWTSCFFWTFLRTLSSIYIDFDTWNGR